MIKLKDLINEIAWKDDTLMMAAKRKIPISAPIMKKVIGDIDVSSFHITDIQNVGKLKSLVGKKKSISTFTRANHDSPLAKGRGIQTGQGGVVFYMKGTLLAKRWMDFDTLPDKTGRRWIAGHYIVGDRQTFTKAYNKAGIPKKREKLFDKIYDVKKKYEKMWLNDDEEMPYDKYKKIRRLTSQPYMTEDTDPE